MGIDHGRLQTAVPQQQLNGPNVGALPQQMRGKGMAQRMNAGVLENPRPIERRLERLLQARLRRVPAQLASSRRTLPRQPRRKRVLPGQAPSCRRILATQALGHRRPASARQHIIPMQRGHTQQMGLQR